MIRNVLSRWFCLSVCSDLQALWRSVSVDGMTEADISAYLQNGGLGLSLSAHHLNCNLPHPLS